jgi:hypothetical protein
MVLCLVRGKGRGHDDFIFCLVKEEWDQSIFCLVQGKKKKWDQIPIYGTYLSVF